MKTIYFIKGMTRKLLQYSFFSILLRAIGLVAGFFMHTTLANNLGKHDYGFFNFSLAMAEIASLVVGLGWHVAVVRFISQYRKKSEYALLKGVLFRAYQIPLAASISLSIMVVVASIYTDLFSEYQKSLLYAAILLPIFILSRLRQRVFQGFQNVLGAIILDKIIIPSIVLCWCAVFPIYAGQDALQIYIGASIAVFFLGIIWLIAILPDEIRVVSPQYKTMSWMKVSIPLMFAGLGSILLNRIDVLMLGYLTDLTSVGLYGAANRVSQVVLFAGGAIQAVATPMVATAYYSNNAKKYKKIIHQTMFLSCLTTIPILLVIMIWVDDILVLFGDEFADANTIVRILVIGQLINAVIGISGPTLSMTGRQKDFLWIVMAAMIFNAIGNAVLIPVLGVYGAAISTSVLLSLSSIYMFWMVRTSHSKV